MCQNGLQSLDLQKILWFDLFVFLTATCQNNSLRKHQRTRVLHERLFSGIFSNKKTRLLSLRIKILKLSLQRLIFLYYLLYDILNFKDFYLVSCPWESEFSNFNGWCVSVEHNTQNAYLALVKLYLSPLYSKVRFAYYYLHSHSSDIFIILRFCFHRWC